MYKCYTPLHTQTFIILRLVNSVCLICLSLKESIKPLKGYVNFLAFHVHVHNKLKMNVNQAGPSKDA